MEKTIHMIESKEARDVIAMNAYTSGLKAGAVAAAVVGTGVVTANTYWGAFRRRLGISGKTALVVSAFLGSFTIVSEKRLVIGARDPERYLAEMDHRYVQKQKQHSHKLKWYERSANFLYDHPYKTLAMVGVPLVGGIFAYQSSNHAIQRSQQIMHTRIYGQGAVVVLLLSSMAFHDYMAKRGRFVVEDDDDEEPEEDERTSHAFVKATH